MKNFHYRQAYLYSTGTPHEAYCIQPLLASVAFRIRCKKGIYILTHTWGFRRCSFRTDRAMRRPTNRGTSDRLAPRFFILYIRQLKNNPAVVARQPS